VRYVKTSWHHAFDDEPVLIYSELDEDRYETRKVEVFRDGRSEWCDENHQTDSIGLSEIPFPTADEVSALPEFDVEEISSTEFERVWADSQDSSRVTG
jgi:hypothetical protein